jgi:hypothetical protein
MLVHMHMQPSIIAPFHGPREGHENEKKKGKKKEIVAK